MSLEIENIEIRLLLEGIHQKYGYDFRDYSAASLKRRIKHHLKLEKIGTISHLQSEILRNASAFERLLCQLTVNVTEMFRDPIVYQKIKEEVFPYLKTYPFLRIWHSGCATGEEVYSMAILLSEEHLYERTQIYATDVDHNILKKAKEAIFPLAVMKEYSRNYHRSGGSRPFSYYYTANNHTAILDRSLKTNIVFADHNLATESVFGEMQMIVCRNVLIYFNRKLQERALSIFKESLCKGGFLCLGTKESLQFSSLADDFETVAASQKIYRKK
jgi:chemotaxis protein methyltransferase CheR